MFFLRTSQNIKSIQNMFLSKLFWYFIILFSVRDLTLWQACTLVLSLQVLPNLKIWLSECKAHYKNRCHCRDCFSIQAVLNESRPFSLKAFVTGLWEHFQVVCNISFRSKSSQTFCWISLQWFLACHRGNTMVQSSNLIDVGH